MNDRYDFNLVSHWACLEHSYETFQTSERLIGKVLQQIKKFDVSTERGWSGDELRHNLCGVDVNLETIPFLFRWAVGVLSPLDMQFMLICSFHQLKCHLITEDQSVHNCLISHFSEEPGAEVIIVSVCLWQPVAAWHVTNMYKDKGMLSN